MLLKIKTYLIVFAACCLLCSCYDIHKETDGFFHQNAFYHYTGEQETGNWTNGKRNGYFRTFNADRSLINKGNYKMGVQEGEWHYFHPNGAIHSQGVFANDQRTGQWQFFHSNSQVKELRSFSNGQNYLLFSWYPDGKEMVVDGNGPYEFYFKGILRESGQYQGGLPSGNWKIYDESGQLTKQFEAQ